MLVLEVSQLTALYLLPHSLQLEIQGEKSHPLQWLDLPELRHTLGNFLLELVLQNQHKWFAHVCGQCGNSCRRPEIVVREQEILALQMHLGIRQEEFRDRYLQPVQSWNPGDGQMALTEEGNCPFLEGGAAGQPQTARCSIHSVRPRSCRELQSNQAYCRKDPSHLLEQITSCLITSTDIVVEQKNGPRHSTLTPPEVWQSLCQAVIQSPPSAKDRRLPEVVELLRDLLEHKILSFKSSEVDSSYRLVVQQLHTQLNNVAALVKAGDNLEAKLKVACSHYHQLYRLVHGSVLTGPRPNPWTALRVQEQSLTAKFAGGEERELVATSLQGPGRVFLQALLETSDEVLQKALCPPDPPCTMCGECCRRYSVEIRPSDITRLSRHLAMSRSDFVEQYTLPGSFGWNLHNRTLKKRPAQTYSKKLLELTLLGEAGNEECVFLERRADGLFYCQVHGHKPDVCQGYETTHSLCRETNHVENAGRQAETLAWVEISGQEVEVQTRQRILEELSPLIIQRSHWKKVDAAARRLEEAAMPVFLSSKLP